VSIFYSYFFDEYFIYELAKSIISLFTILRI